MEHFNQFIRKVGQTNKLTATHFRGSEGYVPNTEDYTKKLTSAAKFWFPAAVISIAVIALAPSLNGDQNTTHASAAIATAAKHAATAPALAAAGVMPANASIDPAAGGSLAVTTPADTITFLKGNRNADAMAILNGIASHTLQTMEVNGEISPTKFPDAATSMYNIPPQLAKGVASVFRAGFIDAYSIMFVAHMTSPDAALAYARELAKGRKESHWAIDLVSTEIIGGADFSNVEIDKLKIHAMSLASQNTGMWLAAGGVKQKTALLYADFVEGVTTKMVNTRHQAGLDHVTEAQAKVRNSARP